MSPRSSRGERSRSFRRGKGNGSDSSDGESERRSRRSRREGSRTSFGEVDDSIGGSEGKPSKPKKVVGIYGNSKPRRNAALGPREDALADWSDTGDQDLSLDMKSEKRRQTISFGAPQVYDIEDVSDLVNEISQQEDALHKKSKRQKKKGTSSESSKSMELPKAGDRSSQAEDRPTSLRPDPSKDSSGQGSQPKSKPRASFAETIPSSIAQGVPKKDRTVRLSSSDEQNEPLRSSSPKVSIVAGTEEGQPKSERRLLFEDAGQAKILPQSNAQQTRGDQRGQDHGLSTSTRAAAMVHPIPSQHISPSHCPVNGTHEFTQCTEQQIPFPTASRQPREGFQSPAMHSTFPAHIPNEATGERQGGIAPQHRGVNTSEQPQSHGQEHPPHSSHTCGPPPAWWTGPLGPSTPTGYMARETRGPMGCQTAWNQTHAYSESPEMHQGFRDEHDFRFMGRLRLLLRDEYEFEMLRAQLRARHRAILLEDMLAETRGRSHSLFSFLEEQLDYSRSWNPTLRQDAQVWGGAGQRFNRHSNSQMGNDMPYCRNGYTHAGREPERYEDSNQRGIFHTWHTSDGSAHTRDGSTQVPQFSPTAGGEAINHQEAPGQTAVTPGLETDNAERSRNFNPPRGEVAEQQQRTVQSAGVGCSHQTSPVNESAQNPATGEEDSSERGRGRGGGRRRPGKRDQTPFNPRIHVPSDDEEDEEEKEKESDENGKSGSGVPSASSNSFQINRRDSGDDVNAQEKNPQLQSSLSLQSALSAVSSMFSEGGDDEGRGRTAQRRRPSKRDQTPFNPKILSQMYGSNDSDESENADRSTRFACNSESGDHSGDEDGESSRGRSEMRRRPSKRDQTPFNPKMHLTLQLQGSDDDDDDGDDGGGVSDATDALSPKNREHGKQGPRFALPEQSSGEGDGDGSNDQRGGRERTSPRFLLPSRDDDESPERGDGGRGRGEMRRKPSKRDQTPFNPRLLKSYDEDSESDNSGDNDDDASSSKIGGGQSGLTKVSGRLSTDSVCSTSDSMPVVSRKVSFEGDGAIGQQRQQRESPVDGESNARGRDTVRRKPGKRDQTPFNPKLFKFDVSDSDSADNLSDTAPGPRSRVSICDTENSGGSGGSGDATTSRGRSEGRRRPSKRDQTPFNPRLLSMGYNDDDDDDDENDESDEGMGTDNHDGAGVENKTTVRSGRGGISFSEAPQAIKTSEEDEEKDKTGATGSEARGGDDRRRGRVGFGGAAEDRHRPRFADTEGGEEDGSSDHERGRGSQRRKPSKRDQTPFNPKLFVMPSSSEESDEDGGHGSSDGSNEGSGEQSGGGGESVVSFQVGSGRPGPRRSSERDSRGSITVADNNSDNLHRDEETGTGDNNDWASTDASTRRGREGGRRKPGKRDQTPFNPKLFKGISDDSDESTNAAGSNDDAEEEKNSGNDETDSKRTTGEVSTADQATHSTTELETTDTSQAAVGMNGDGGDGACRQVLSGSPTREASAGAAVAPTGLPAPAPAAGSAEERPRGREESRPELHKVLSNSKRASTREQTPFYISRQLSNQSEVDEEYTDICRRRSRRRESTLPEIAEDESVLNSSALPCFSDEEDGTQEAEGEEGAGGNGRGSTEDSGSKGGAGGMSFGGVKFAADVGSAGGGGEVSGSGTGSGTGSSERPGVDSEGREEGHNAGDEGGDDGGAEQGPRMDAKGQFGEDRPVIALERAKDDRAGAEGVQLDKAPVDMGGERKGEDNGAEGRGLPGKDAELTVESTAGEGPGGVQAA